MEMTLLALLVLLVLVQLLLLLLLLLLHLLLLLLLLQQLLYLSKNDCQIITLIFRYFLLAELDSQELNLSLKNWRNKKTILFIDAISTMEKVSLKLHIT